MGWCRVPTRHNFIIFHNFSDFVIIPAKNHNFRNIFIIFIISVIFFPCQFVLVLILLFVKLLLIISWWWFWTPINRGSYKITIECLPVLFYMSSSETFSSIPQLFSFWYEVGSLEYLKIDRALFLGKFILQYYIFLQNFVIFVLIFLKQWKWLEMKVQVILNFL